jgi:5-methyltetrahydrofolate corrinoid/iron sulfur protein methyltransferase
MLIIGENIHIISKKVREAVEKRDKDFIQDLAKRQVEKGAQMLDINLGPMKRNGAEIMIWVVNTIQEVVDIPFSLDTTNSEAIEAGLKVCKRKPLINSTNADPERLKVLMPLAAKYNADLIALALRPGSLPVASADVRIEIVASDLLTAAIEYGMPLENLYIDPLVMTVNGTQEHAPEVIKATKMVKLLSDPPLKTACGLSNVSNGCPHQIRSLLNRIYLIMLVAAGMDAPILNSLDDELMETIRIIENRDDSTPKRKLYLALYGSVEREEEFNSEIADMSDPEQSSIVKTIQILENKTLYAHKYLEL